MIGTLTLTHLGWFVTSSENPFGYPLYYLDLQALAFRADIKLDDRHGQAVEFALIDLTSPITNEIVTYASIIKLHDETILWLDKPKEPVHTNLKLDFGVRSSTCEMENCPHCAYEQQQEYEAELEKDACIDFAKWLSQSDWMSIWVKDKWMWECQLEDSKLGYKTEEELYKIYLNEV